MYEAVFTFIREKSAKNILHIYSLSSLASSNSCDMLDSESMVTANNLFKIKNKRVFNHQGLDSSL